MEMIKHCIECGFSSMVSLILVFALGEKTSWKYIRTMEYFSEVSTHSFLQHYIKFISHKVLKKEEGKDETGNTSP